MYFFAFDPKRKFSSMAVFAKDPFKVVNDILDTSETCRNHDRAFVLEPHKVLSLDSGGMYFNGEKEHPFTVDGHQFTIQLSRVEEMLLITDRKEERIPGYKRFRNFQHNVIMPTELLDKVREELTRLAKLDATLHAQITNDEARAKLEEQGLIIRANLPRERQ